MNHLRNMSVFARIVESGSITAAAELLGLSKSVVSQHLKTLEEELGTTLLKRTTRKQHLTDAGKGFYAHCCHLNDIADQALRELQDTHTIPTGEVAITAPYALMEPFVVQAISDLVQQYPQLKIRLHASDEHLDLVAENIDIALRVGKSKSSTIKQRRVGAFKDILCVHSRYATTPLENIGYIANVWQGNEITHHFKSPKGEEFIYTAKARCRANSFHTCLSLVETGAGMGLIPEFSFKQSPYDLCEVFPKYILPSNPIYLLHTFSGPLPLSVKVCIHAIEAMLR